ncbi:MAG TPA: hypothetical protein VFK05_38750 [Polyangiaceae bacterium]|nr:hypothetical protein [Polyangiaceae bacterium]
MPEELRIVSVAEFKALRLEPPASFRLRFPEHWRAIPVKNPYAAALERRTLGWLREYDMGTEPSEAERLRRFDVGRYGGYSLPHAGFEAALIVTQYISLWLFWDDLQVEEDLAWNVGHVVQALHGEWQPSTSDSRYLAAWADLGKRLRSLRSPAWLARLSSSMQEWLDNAKRETEWARAHRERKLRVDIDELFACRTTSIGMYPTFHLIELCEGIELDDAFHGLAEIRELKRLASRLVGLGNELCGVAKDLQDRWLNLVPLTAERRQLSLAAAFEAVVDAHNADVLAFDDLASRLPSLGPDTDLFVPGWVQAVRHNVYGFALWESLAERYQATKAIVGSTPLIAEVATTDSLPIQRRNRPSLAAGERLR